jgi:hypothetical protein
MEAVNIVMRLFKAMDEAEKKEVVLQIGNELDGSGLADKWEAKTSAPKKKRRGSYKPYWMKRVDGVDKRKRGMDQLAGGWVSQKEIAELKDGTVVLLGIKGGDYCVCHVAHGNYDFEDARGEKHIVHGIVCDSRYDEFKQAVNACELLLEF